TDSLATKKVTAGFLSWVPLAVSNSRAILSQGRLALKVSVSHLTNGAGVSRRLSEVRGSRGSSHTSALRLPYSELGSNWSISFARLSGSVLSRNAFAFSADGTTPVMSRLTRRRNSASLAPGEAGTFSAVRRESTAWSILVARSFACFLFALGE